METTNARILTLEEIKSLSKASVIWRVSHQEDDDYHIHFHTVNPALIAVPGENGLIVGGDVGSLFCHDINDELINDGILFWSAEPAEEQLTDYGIPEAEFNKISMMRYEEESSIISIEAWSNRSK